MSPTPSSIRAAAIQFEGVVGNVATNLERIERLLNEAVATGARLIALPEFFTSPIVFAEATHRAVLPPENAARDLLLRMARQHQVWIGGSMLVADKGEIFNRYHLVEPDGTVHLHDKDLPTMWEGAFYGRGRDDGRFSTALGEVGAAVCWELIRSQTVRRLRGVGVAMTGTHWWTTPFNWGVLTDSFNSIAQYNRYLSENAPVEFARRLGAPVLQASHCGKFTTNFMLVPGLPLAPRYDTAYVGNTQIVDASGKVLAARNQDEGPGVVTAEINLGAVAPRVALEDRFWIPALPLFLKAYWHQQNACAKVYYRSKGLGAGLEAAEKAAR